MKKFVPKRSPEKEQEVRMVKIVTAPCGYCGRKFSVDRLATHEAICRNGKLRKPFDSAKQRLEGTPMAAYNRNRSVRGGGRGVTPKDKPQSNWRETHRHLILTLRNARAAARNGGRCPREMPAPLAAELAASAARATAHYETCPYCERRFNPEAAARHIPICSNLNNKNFYSMAERRPSSGAGSGSRRPTRIGLGPSRPTARTSATSTARPTAASTIRPNAASTTRPTTRPSAKGSRYDF